MKGEGIFQPVLNMNVPEVEFTINCIIDQLDIDLICDKWKYESNSFDNEDNSSTYFNLAAMYT